MIFIDTGAFVARYRRSDEWHRLAVQGWDQIERGDRRLFTHALCIAEAVTLITRYAGIDVALRFGHNVLDSEITVLRSDNADDIETLALMQKYADQSVGFTDCSCFWHMRQHRLLTVFGFDSHFQTAGFRLWPPRK